MDVGGIAKVVALVAAIVVILDGAMAMTLCNVTVGFTACKPSVTPPNPVMPSPECCEAVTGADLQCFCSYKNSFLLPSLGIDPDLALALPAKCNVPSPPNC
ncbi:putative lipid-transfer protein DIR1 [Salvia hispanica]|uniref:putative lipid-transfer protein DIR1 n=1 Tax=Salvia hispanica TaxID=49212 RepID=UPI0020096AA8|nr:putative lipid-transfer protein DIR1 [Salvia hispanica]